MAKKISKRVKTLNGFMKWVEQFNDGQYLFRGVSKHTHKLEASAYRRLPEADRNNSDRLLKINRELINKARLLGHDRKDGHYFSDLELLAELQHFSAATCLIDFTRSAQIALWFACQQSSTGEANGKVFAIRSDDPAIFRTITPELVTEKNIEYFFEEDEQGRGPLYQWQPKQQNNRIIAQQSVFVFGASEIAAVAECVILKSGKSEILDSLDNSAGITEASIYPDFDGFARLHAQNQPHIEPNVQGYLQRGTEAHLEGKLDDAIVYYTEVVSLQPDSSILAKTHILRGSIYVRKRKYNLAIDDFTKTIDEDPNEVMAYYSRGTIYGINRENDLAIKDYTKALELNPEFTQVYVQRATAYVANDEIELALKDYDKAIELNPDYAEAYGNRGGAYAKKDDFDNAIKDLDKAIQLNPDYAEAHYYRGSAYAIKGDFDNAIKDLDKAIQLNPDYAEAYGNRGGAYAEKDDFDNAIKDLDKAIELNPDYAEAYGNRGSAYARKGDFDSAIKDYTEAIQLNLDEAEVYCNRGNAYARKGDFDSAIKDYTEAIQLNLDEAEVYCNRGEARLHLQEWEKAKSDLTTAKKLGADITASFQNDYENVADFEQKTGIQLPEDIAEMLTQ